MLLKILAIGAALLAHGCAIHPIVLENPPPSILMENPNGKAEIVVYRKGIMAFAIGFGVYINDLHVGELHANDFVHHFVEPGRVKMFAGSEARSPASFPVEVNRVYYFRALPQMGWWFARVQLEVAEDPNAAREATQRCDDKTFAKPRSFPFEVDSG